MRVLPRSSGSIGPVTVRILPCVSVAMGFSAKAYQSKTGPRSCRAPAAPSGSDGRSSVRAKRTRRASQPILVTQPVCPLTLALPLSRRSNRFVRIWRSSDSRSSAKNTIETSPGSPLAAPMTVDGFRVGNRFTIHPMGGVGRGNRMGVRANWFDGAGATLAAAAQSGFGVAKRWRFCPIRAPTLTS